MCVPYGGRLYQYSAGIACQLSVVAAGTVFAWLEPLTLKLSRGEVEGLDLSPETVSWLVAFVEAGCLVSPPISGILANKFGRKVVILSAGPLCLIGWLMLLFSTSLPIFFFVRFLQGLVVGLTLTVPPMYTAEICEPQIRGRISGILQVAWYLGILYSFIVGHHLSYRSYIFACIPIPLIFTAAFANFPESPYYLLKSGKIDDAERSLKAFRGTADATKEFEDMKKTVAKGMTVKSSWGALFFDPFERKAFIIVQIVSISKYLTGLPTIENYATETFSMASGWKSPEDLTIILGCLLCVVSALSAILADFIGRRRLVLVSCFGMFVSQLLTGTYFFLKEKTSVDASPFVHFVYVGLSSYCVFSSIGSGPLLQTLQAEMFSFKTQELAGGLTEALTAVFSFASLKAFRPINEYFGIYLNFLVYCGVGLICGILLTFLMFEPNGKPIGTMSSDNNEIDKNTTTKLLI